MLHSVFERTLHDQRRSLVGWVLGVVAYTALIVAMYPMIRDRPDLQRVISDYPEALRKMFGITDMASPAGYLNAELLSLMVPMLVIIYAVLTGGDATAGEEERGTIDLLLANPIPRARVLLEKSAAIGLGTAILGASVYATIIALGPLVHLAVPYAHLAEAVAGIVLVAALFGAVAVAVGALTGMRGASRGVAGALAAGAYLLSSLSGLVSGLRPWRLASPYWHAIGVDPMHHGLGIAHVALLALLLAVLVATAAWSFDRRDLAT